MLLITGANGQLGSELLRLLPDALATTSAVLDITNEDKVRDFIFENKVDTIINCAAYTAVDKAEDEPELAAAVNEKGVFNLARNCQRLIHISTDYVFDGKSCRPYAEEDLTNPLSVYGKTKLAGEIAALDNALSCVVIRTSWLYSSLGEANFVRTMLRLGQERENLNVVFDQVGTPTNAADLAAAIVKILPNITTDTKGLYHFSNEGICSWYDFAYEIMREAGLFCRVNPIESKDYPTKAVRPFYSVLNKAKIKKDFGVDIPYWKESFIKCLKQF